MYKRQENNGFAEEGKVLVSSCIHDLSEEEIALYEGLGWELKGMVAHYAYDKVICEDYLPEFNEEFTEYEIFDYVNERQGIVHRTIESNDLPTLMRFGSNMSDADYTEGNELSVLEIYDMDTREITDCYRMFKNCKNLTKIICDWNTSKAVSYTHLTLPTMAVV